MPIRDLAAHAAPYVTVGELSEYWAVSRQQIYKRIQSGALDTIRFGSRLYRVRTSAALEYERRASVNGASCGTNPQTTVVPASQRDTLPPNIGLQRVLRKFRIE